MSDKLGPDLTDSGSAPAHPQPPRTIRFAIIAIGVQIALTVIGALLSWGFTSELTQSLINHNNGLKAGDKNKKSDYVAGSAQVIHDLHQSRVSVTVYAIIVGVIFALVAFAVWRGIGMARWLYIVVALFFSLGGLGALGADGPGLLNALSFLVSIAVIVAVVFVILPDSARYFAAMKKVRYPAKAGAPARGGYGLGGAGGARPVGLRGLFRPPPASSPVRPPSQAKTSSPRKAAKVRPATATEPTEPTGPIEPTAVATESAAPTGRGKPKARTGGTGNPDGSTPTTAPPASGRGKSRR